MEIFRLICTISLFALSNASPSTESDMGIWRQDTSFSNGVYSIQKQISFRTIFSATPKVSVGLITFDIQRDCPGVDVTINSVDTTGFTFTLYRGYSSLYAADFSWIAINDPKVAVLTYTQGSVTLNGNTFTNTVNSGNGYLTADFDVTSFGFSQPNTSVMINGFAFTNANYYGNINNYQNRGFEVSAYPKNQNTITVVFHAYNKNTITRVILFIVGIKDYLVKASIIVYENDGYFSSFLLDPGANALQGTSTPRKTTLDTSMISSTTPVFIYGISSFYYVNTKNLRFSTLGASLSNSISDIWDLSFEISTWADSNLFNVKFSTFSVLDTSSFLIDCSGSTPTDLIMQARVCSGCNLFFTPDDPACIPTLPAPCRTPNFQYWNSSCLSSCPSPFIQDIQADTSNCLNPCSPDLYLAWNGSCFENCSFPLRGSMIDGDKYCDHPCPSQILYWNETCADECLAPLVQRVEPSNTYCDYPCQFGEFLYWNGTCGDICLFPLANRTEAGELYCDFPCGSDEILYWNGTCGNECSQPLVKRLESNKAYCDYPCSNNYFLYWNGSCMNACEFPLSQRLESDKLFCDFLCANDEILYWNGTCMSNCISPLEKRLEAGKAYCDYPCANNQFLYWNKTCKNQCSSPLSQRIESNKLYCDFPCADDEILYWNGTCQNNCNFPLSKRVEPSNTYCDYPCPINKFLYWNGSCIDSCKIPLSPQNINGNLFCNYPCQPNRLEYLNWNGTCIKSCPSNLVQVKFQGKFYCNLPVPDFTFTQSASNSKIFFLEFNQNINQSLAELNTSFVLSFGLISSNLFEYKVTQIDEKSFQIYIEPFASLARQSLTLSFVNKIFNYFGAGLKKNVSTITVSPLYSAELIKSVQQLKSTSQTALASVGSFSIPIVILASNPIFLWILLNLIQTYYYLLFINVEYPLNLESLLSLFSVGTFSFIPNLFASMNIGDFNQIKLGSPKKFANENFDSFFLATGGGNISIIFGFLFLSFVSILISKYMRSMPFGLLQIARKVVSGFVPNILNIWQAIFLNINIAAFLQLQNLHSEDNTHRASSVLAYLVAIMSLIVIIYYFYQGKLYIKKAKNLEIFNMEIDYKIEHQMCMMYPCIDLLQKFLFALLLVFLYEYQRTLIALLMIEKFAFTFYLMYYKPFKDPVSNVSNSFSEMLYIVAILLVGILHKMNSDPEIKEDEKLKIGYMIIALCMTTVGFYVFIMTASAVLKGKILMAKYSLLRKNRALKEDNLFGKRKVKRPGPKAIQSNYLLQI